MKNKCFSAPSSSFLESTPELSRGENQIESIKMITSLHWPGYLKISSPHFTSTAFTFARDSES